jgi:hypothetical protein
MTDTELEFIEDVVRSAHKLAADIFARFRRAEMTEAGDYAFKVCEAFAALAEVIVNTEGTDAATTETRS